MAPHSAQSLEQSRLLLVPGAGVGGRRPRVVIVGAGFAGLQHRPSEERSKNWSAMGHVRTRPAHDIEPGHP